jgi:hypothetical protein
LKNVRPIFTAEDAEIAQRVPKKDAETFRHHQLFSG